MIDRQRHEKLDTDRQIYRQREIQTDIQTNKHTQTEILRNIHNYIDRYLCMQTEMMEIQTEKDIQTKQDRQTTRLTCRSLIQKKSISILYNSS